MKSSEQTSVRVLRCIWVTAIGLLMIGCSSGSPGPKTVKVSGKVTYKGQPVTSGVVNFYDAASGHQSQGALAAGGAYSIPAVVVGSYKISIAPPPFVGGMGPDGKEKSAPPAPENIPAKYHTAETSGFTAAVSAGSTTHNFDMVE